MWKLFDVDWIRNEYYGKIELLIVAILFSPIFLTGLLGNLWLIVTILRKEIPVTSSTIYTLSLALCDLCTILGLIPMLLSTYVTESSESSSSTPSQSSSLSLISPSMASSMCILSDTLRDITVSVSSLTLIAVSLDRYLAVLSAVAWMQKQVDRKHRNLALGTIYLIWLISILLALPTSLSSHLTPTQLTSGTTLLICTPGFTFLPQPGSQILITMKTIIFYLFPLIITSYCYSNVARKLVFNVKNKLTYRKSSKDRALRKASFTVRLAFLLVGLFALSFLPHHLVNLYYYFKPIKSTEALFWQTARITSFMCIFINSVVNPIIICSTSCHLKKLIKSKISFLKDI
ncbi:neuropeptide CCHamide-2 receptor-like [Panonychus citri]|uniref:neuropeptide CCHamide-2 receptor-like n=1 Tax=Panonychus citri TaxID=50023 RepID=UPI0023078C6F|nr:neuropeptide CCHamide-2 receptor-like [Panonychus citri]